MAVTSLKRSKTASGSYYERYGQENSAAGKEAILFIHGVGMNCRVWEPQVRAFAKTYQIIIYDTLGHGLSPLPSEHAGLEEYIAQLLELIESLGLKKVHIVGHSMGALVATAFALRHEDRILSLSAMMGVYDRTENHRERSKATAKLLAEVGPTAALEKTFARWFSREDHADPRRAKDIARIKGWLADVDLIGYARAYRVFAENSDAFVGRLGELSVPALFLTGENDPNSTPEMSRKMAAATPKGRLCVLKGERHMAPHLAAETVNRELGSFLAEQNSNECSSVKSNHKEAAQ